jgi:hypothetical protein
MADGTQPTALKTAATGEVSSRSRVVLCSSLISPLSPFQVHSYDNFVRSVLSSALSECVEFRTVYKLSWPALRPPIANNGQTIVPTVCRLFEASLD